VYESRKVHSQAAILIENYRHELRSRQASEPTIFASSYNFSVMQSLVRNLRFGARLLGKNPGFAAATILTLALGIGANTAIFTVTSALLLRPFPYRGPEHLVTVVARDNNGDFPCTLMRYELVRDAGKSFQSVAVWTNDNLNLTGFSEPIQVPIARVSPKRRNKRYGSRRMTPGRTFSAKYWSSISSPIWGRDA